MNCLQAGSTSRMVGGWRDEIVPLLTAGRRELRVAPWATPCNLSLGAGHGGPSHLHDQTRSWAIVASGPSTSAATLFVRT